jgi:hypothetical protein
MAAAGPVGGETVAEVARTAVEAAEVEIAAVVDAGDGTHVGQLVGGFEDREILEELRGERAHGVGEILDLGVNARAGGGLGRHVAAVVFGDDVELGEGDDFFGFGRVGWFRRGGDGLGAEAGQGEGERAKHDGEAGMERHGVRGSECL